MPGKQRNTAIEYIKDKNSRVATQFKRTSGLIKKAAELHHLCGVRVLLAIQSTGDSAETALPDKGGGRVTSVILNSESYDWPKTMCDMIHRVSHSANNVQVMTADDYDDVFTRCGKGWGSINQLPASFKAPSETKLVQVVEKVAKERFNATASDLVVVDDDYDAGHLEGHREHFTQTFSDRYTMSSPLDPPPASPPTQERQRTLTEFTQTRTENKEETPIPVSSNRARRSAPEQSANFASLLQGHVKNLVRRRSLVHGNKIRMRIHTGTRVRQKLRSNALSSRGTDIQLEHALRHNELDVNTLFPVAWTAGEPV